MRIRFTQRLVVALGEGKNLVYNAGDEHTFEGMVTETYGRKYVRRGWAVEVPDPLDHDSDGKRGGSKPGEPGDRVMTAAELLAALEAEPSMQFFTFKAEAEKILGAATPAKKADIVAALEALATDPTAQPPA